LLKRREKWRGSLCLDHVDGTSEHFL